MRKSKMIEENTDKKLNSKKEKNSIEGTLELPRRQSEDEAKTKRRRSTPPEQKQVSTQHF